MSTNRSAFVDGQGQSLRIADIEIPKPGANDIIVKNYAVAVNTIDPAQANGFMIKKWPIVIGQDLAGEVFDVGSSVIRFKKGDRVIGHARQFLTGNPEDGAFSLYSRVLAANAALLPSHVSYTQGAVLPLALDTVAGGFYNKDILALDLPSLDAKPLDKVVIMYGGSSSVGVAAIQLAVCAGYRVIATASPKNFDLLREAGASDVFDYKSATIAEDIHHAVGKSEFVGLYNAIGIPESFDVVTPIVQRLGGGIVANTKPPGPLPEDVKAKFVLGVHDFGFPIWESFVGAALESGKLKALPEAKIVGHGLESLQDAFKIRDGEVSAQKIVVVLQEESAS